MSKAALACLANSAGVKISKMILQSGLHVLFTHLVLFCVIYLTGQNQTSVATWMYLGLVSSSLPRVPDTQPHTLPSRGFRPELAVLPAVETPNPSDWCGSIGGLVDYQRALCRRNPEVFWQVREAAKLAITECQYQFRNERWNCTTTNDRRVFGKTMSRSTKETAFITAISTAAVVHSVVKACSSGNISDCGCDSREGQKHGAGWTWSGCTDNVDYGMWFSRQFNDAQETIKRKDARNVKDAMHLHNKDAGRVIVHRQVQKDCRCHGVSGSCEVKTCWKKMSPFRDTGTALKKKYDNAVWIAKKYATKLKRRGGRGKTTPITNNELVYLDKSPDYCKKDRARGVLGTTGRVCNATSSAPNGCASLCCGRGHNTQVIWKHQQCHCRFVWCCEVKCKTCNTRVEIHTCK